MAATQADPNPNPEGHESYPELSRGSYRKGTHQWTSSPAAPPVTLLVVPGGPGLGQLLWARVSCPCSVDDPGAKVTCCSRALVTADKGNGPQCVRSFAGVGAGGAGLSTGWPHTHAARGGTKMNIEDIEVFIGTGRR